MKRIMLVWVNFVWLGLFLLAAADRPVSYQDIMRGSREDWLTYSGDYFSQRHSSLTQINRQNVGKLELQWRFKVGPGENLRSTPLVHNGVMYVTNAKGVYALDTTDGHPFWYWRAHEGPSVGLNRGVALLGHRVFFITGDCRIVALDQCDGTLLWQRQYADPKQGYYSTLAPLALADRVVAGVSGGENGVRGLVAAFAPEDGRELWRFWTTPVQGEPGAETWGSFNPEKGGAATWMTGSFDWETNTVFWTTGSARLDFEGGEKRPGDNLYSNCLLALDAASGRLKWYFQFTPHDVSHWDANEIPVLVNMGKARRLVLQANRNGFFYVLDRETGEFISGWPFVSSLTWATGLNRFGRPLVVPGKESPWTSQEKGICPGISGATNWMSPTFDPRTGLFCVVAWESCDNGPITAYLRALNLFSSHGRMVWQYPLAGTKLTLGGVLSTAGDLIFTTDRQKNLLALNAENGELLWQNQLDHFAYASPISYMVDGQQQVAIVAGDMVYVFGLTPPKEKHIINLLFFFWERSALCCRQRLFFLD